MEKGIYITIGVFNVETQSQDWKVDSRYKTQKEGYVAFKELCKKIAAYTYEELVEVYNTPRLDVELMEGDTLIKWFGIYEKPIKETESEEEEK